METDRETTWTDVFKIMISNGPKTLAKIPVQTQAQNRIDLSRMRGKSIIYVKRGKTRIIYFLSMPKK